MKTNILFLCIILACLFNSNDTGIHLHSFLKDYDKTINIDGIVVYYKKDIDRHYVIRKADFLINIKKYQQWEYIDKYKKKQLKNK